MIELLAIYSAFNIFPAFGNTAAIFSCKGEFDIKECQRLIVDKGVTVGILLEEKQGQYHARYFTSICELPFCVHGSLCLAKYLLETQKNLINKFSCKLFSISFFQKSSEIFCSADINITEVTTELQKQKFLQALGLSKKYLASSIKVIDSGNVKAYIEIRSKEDLFGISIDNEQLKHWSELTSISGVYLYFRQDSKTFITRGLNPKAGVAEDRATGVAAVGLMHLFSNITDNIIIKQGRNHCCEILAYKDGESRIWVGGAVKKYMR